MKFPPPRCCSANRVAEQYERLPTKDWKIEFKENEIPINPSEFWVGVHDFENATGVRSFADLATVVLYAYAIPLSNAFVERIFSYVTNVKTKNRNRLNTVTLDAILRIRSHLHQQSICCKDFTVTPKMLSLFNNSMYQNLTPTLSLPSTSASSASTGSTENHDVGSEDHFNDVLHVAF